MEENSLLSYNKQFFIMAKKAGALSLHLCALSLIYNLVTTTINDVHIPLQLDPST